MSSYPSAPNASKAGGAGGGGGDASEFTVTIPSANIDADLTDFPLVIENKRLSPIGTAWFALAASGTISAFDSEGTELESEVAYFDASEYTLRLHVKTDLSSSSDTVITIKGTTAPAVTGTVFDAYELVVPFAYALSGVLIKDFSPNDHSGTDSWDYDVTGLTAPVFNGHGLGMGYSNNNMRTDDISIATNLYLITDCQYGSIGTYTVAGLSDGTGSMDGLMLRNASTYGTIASYGDSSGGWLEPDGTGEADRRNVGERWVGSLTYESGVERSIWRDGIGKGTDGTVENPFVTKTRCTVGCRDTLGEDFKGVIYEVRAADFIPSDAWVKAEALNMGNNSLYTIS